MPNKIDFKRTFDAYRAKPGQFKVVEVPDMQYLTIDGHGDPNSSPAFTEAISSLYPLAYKLKFASKQQLGRDYVVPPLEGLWWAENMNSFTSARDKSRWDWKLMIMTPDWIEQRHFETAIEQVEANSPPVRLGDVKLQVLSEGLCVQTLHVGSFDDEAATLAQMHHEFIPSQGLHMVGKHHEIYFSDFRKVAPEKLRTLLRQPVMPAA